MKRSLLLILLIYLFAELFSQPCEFIVEESFDSIPFAEFVKQVENKFKIHFFLKSSWIDTLLVSNKEKSSSLQKILNENFKETGLSYYIYDCSKIIITKDYAYVVDIPESMLNQEISSARDEPLKYDESSFIKVEYRKDYQNNNGIISVGDPSYKYVGKNATVSGYINDTVNNMPVIGAVIYFDDLESATITDENGHYSINVDKGKHLMHIKSVGKKEKSLEIVVFSSGTHNESLEDEAVTLKEVYVYADKEHNVRGLQLGFEKLDAKTIKLIPSTVGEADIFKMTLLLPGVQSVGEGASGFNVRGGSADQNLILIDNSPVYNSSHLFGFFSAINAEMVEDFKLFKSSYPAYYGGRLSSVFDVTLKEGNYEEFSLQGGISPITGKLLIEGPLVKDKISYVVSGRSTYSDWILNKINTPMLQNSNASFYDLNAKLNFKVNKNNSVQLSGYYSTDNFKFSDTTYSYNNLNGSILWKHSFTDRLSVTTTALFSEYRYNMKSAADSVFAFRMFYSIQHYEGKIDFLYLLNEKHKVRLGVNSIKYSLDPGTLNPDSEASNIAPLKLNSEQGVEAAVFINDEFTVTDHLLVNLGFRYSFYYSLGPATVYKYADDVPRDFASRNDSSLYGRNEVTGKYGYPEFRISARYQLSGNNSIKASYTTMSQYIHMLTNTMAVSPTDTWVLSNPNLKPQRSHQYSIGYYHNFFHSIIEASVEAYYKESENMLEFKPGAKLLLNPDLEIDLLAGRGRSYGIELMVKKKYGKLNGWMSYTYSRSLIQVDGNFPEEQINGGKYYPTNYDKPHDFTVVSNYKISRRLSLSATVTYNTGHPVTYPVAWYNFRGRELLHYSNRNEYRIPDYFRMDFAINIEGNLRKQKLAHSSFSFSVYNLTGRDNVYSVYFVSDPNRSVQGYKLSVFARAIPSITYNFKF